MAIPRSAGALLAAMAVVGCKVRAPIETPTCVTPPADIVTYHDDNGRTGRNLKETVLTPANVGISTFAKLVVHPVDGDVYAQPLVVRGVSIPGLGARDVVYVATEHDSVYAFDAAARGLLWHTSFLRPAEGVTTVSSEEVGTQDIEPEIGITGTPVIDRGTGTLYVVAKTREAESPTAATSTARYAHRLHALDLATGASKFGGPVEITAAVRGTGAGSVGGRVAFQSLRQLQRAGLLLSNGVVYIAWGSHGDQGPSHGWILGYDARTLQQVAVFNTTPSGDLGTIWQSGAAPAADDQGNIYVSTGNGTFDPGRGDFGDSFLELSTCGGGLTLVDWFTPHNQAELSKEDQDLGSGGVMLLPDQPGGPRHLLIGAGKEGPIYVVDRDHMGHYHADRDAALQVLRGAIPRSFGAPAFFGDRVYYIGGGDVLKAFSLSSGLLSEEPVARTQTFFGWPGATPSISANGADAAIVWAVRRGDDNRAVLHAYEASSLRELYSSTQADARDNPGRYVKFSVPTIANGRVYVGTRGGLAVFGLLGG